MAFEGASQWGMYETWVFEHWEKEKRFEVGWLAHYPAISSSVWQAVFLVLNEQFLQILLLASVDPQRILKETVQGQRLV